MPTFGPEGVAQRCTLQLCRVLRTSCGCCWRQVGGFGIWHATPPCAVVGTSVSAKNVFGRGEWSGSLCVALWRKGQAHAAGRRRTQAVPFKFPFGAYAGTGVNIGTTRGSTPLHVLAGSTQQAQVAGMLGLLLACPDLDLAPLCEGRTPLQVAEETCTPRP